MTMRKGEEEEEEEECLVMATTKVVEYLEPSMSKGLLCKFPDNLVFDFDYTQSSIWSPLVTKAYSPMDLDFELSFMTPRKLSFGLELSTDLRNKNKLKKVTSNIKKKISTTSFNINHNLLKIKHKKKIKASEFSPTPMKNTCYPAAIKAWTMVLKAASKGFKKKTKKDHTAYHRKPSNYLRDHGTASRG
ncbi:hypothetical protein I3843_04G066400 [Carya illinoinensis]|uniref:Uncharacterized protein n=1 Tax=Carya illinoinensis TaxID=32201 RepID=A0A8T1QT72_CARIL|nr:uncharacterized protein LOC122307529 [Carya illinoinensis]KAG2711335.1 hypothetical protein I3760_04G072100 [Carya illinoinensis]KAG6657182.1 hypothetical protein CIPAW_04G072200 [Carya illinoinensis]KAG6716923.1 hypothetical protein I3842_04G072500 [Carya illinoinensis]KAG7982697.1 hypothetical protein I3843_04G066400 [Carya illinoinensis]